MLRGFYTAASGILQQQRTINVLSNNMVNSQTPGYRASRVVSSTFEMEYLARIEKNNNAIIGTSSPVRIVSDVPVRFNAGNLEETLRPYDMAIDGEGYFMVQNENTGTNYLTRNGNFDVDENGILVLRGTGPVLDTQGRGIYVGDADFTLYSDGTIVGSTGQIFGQIAVVNPAQNAEMRLVQNGLYTTDMAGVTQVQNPSLLQGWIEKTNIDVGQEYTLVMEAQRAFQACSTALQIIDRINQKAASQIAAV